MTKDKIPHFETFSVEQLALVLKMNSGTGIVVVRDDDANTVRIDIHKPDGTIEKAMPLSDQAIAMLAKAYPRCKIIMLVGQGRKAIL